jgi:hypothetical protein
MNAHIFGLTPCEQEVLSQSALPLIRIRQLAKLSSPISTLSEPPKLKKIFFKSPSPAPLSSQQPRYFARGDQNKQTPLPFFELLTETRETPHPRPIPLNRPLLKTLCRGKGTLKRNKQGLVYLDIDDQFILALYPYLRSQGLARPPFFNLFSSPDGAHITVVPTRESLFQDLGPLKEEGEQFSFEIEGLYSLSNPGSWPEVEKVWFFKVRCPELEKVRRKYFLPPLPGGHSFMIALAIKPSTANRAQKVTHRINPSINVA